jgi:hypothetical protein
MISAGGTGTMHAQEVLNLPGQTSASHENTELPDAPRPQIEMATLVAAFDQPSADGQQSGTSSSTQVPASGSQQPNTQTEQQKSVHDLAQEQIKIQEKQRAAGVIPQFNTSYRHDAAPLSAGQKMDIAWHTIKDPETIAVSFLTGAYHEINDGDRVLKPGSTTVYIRENGTGFSWGPAGYFERQSAGYLDSIDGTLIGNAFLPILLHQDPRYFRLGHGNPFTRIVYAASTSFICKADKSRKWEPNYSNVLGNIIAGELSNFYYPAGTPTKIGFTVQTALIQTFEGSAGSVLQEFWPDFARKFLHQDPTHGMDAAYRNADSDEKAQKKQK